MIGIIVAAGLGSRMGSFSETKPKCLLKIAGRTLLDRTVENLQAIGCEKIVVVVGHKGEMINHPDIDIVPNLDYSNNNILHSLMYARDYLTGPVVVTYSDIWVEPHIHRTLMEMPGDIVLSVDRDWMPYYEGRTLHPINEAENVLVEADGRVIETGKHLSPGSEDGKLCGEFLGLWRMSAAGTKSFRDAFERLDATLDPQRPFSQAAQWRKAYITDFVQYLVDQGVCVDCSLIERGWAELDTSQDYQRLTEIAARQGLATISTHGDGQ